MKRLSKIAIAGSLYLSLGLSLAASSAVAATKWIRAESDHFVVYSNVNAKATEAYVRNLEKYRYVIGAFYRRSGADAVPEPKLNLYFVDDHSDFKQVWPDVSLRVGGFVRICSNGMAGYSLYGGDSIRNTAKIERQEENSSQTIIFHEYAHMFMFQNSRVIYPRWFVEGFADYYGSTRVQDDQAVVGMASSGRVRELVSGGSLRYDDILRGTPNTRQMNNMSAFYAQSWLLTHWIMADPARAKAFTQYLAAHNAGEDPVTAFEAAFGVPVKKLSSTLGTYMRSLKATIYRLKDMPDPGISLSTLPESADKLLLWDSGVRSCLNGSYKPEVLKKIKTEAVKYPADDYVKGVVARADLLLGDEALSLDHYLKYTQAHPDDAEGFFRLGQTWFLMAEHGKFAPNETRDSQMRKAREALGKAYTLDPLNAVNLYYLSRAGTKGPNYPDQNTVNAAIEAHNLAPAVPEFALHAARLLIMKGNLAEARYTLLPLANNPHGGSFAEWIASVVAAINAGKSKDEVQTLINARPKKDADDDDKDEKKK